MHCNGVNIYLFVNGVEIYKFKAKDSKNNVAPLCLGNISKDFFVDNMKKNQNDIIWYFYNFGVDYDATAVDNILDIHKYLMKKNGIK